MIKFIVAKKGEGKTKILIEDANIKATTTDGLVVFIDKTKRYMYDLESSIRFVDTEAFPLSNYGEFVGFIYGILSQNSDISEIFVDGLGKIIKKVDDESLIKLVKKLEVISSTLSVDFVISISAELETLPFEIKALAQ